MKIRSLALLLFLPLATPAFAIDFTTRIRPLDGSEFKDASGATVEITLGSVSINMLSNTDDKSLNGDQKIKRYLLAQKIHLKPKDPELSVDEIALIKTLIGNNQPPAISGPAWLLLDPSIK